MEPVRIGIIGQGVIGHHHLEATLSSEYTELTAVADFYPERMKDAEEAGVERTYTAGRELIDGDDEVEAVILAMPSGVRTSLALRALSRGKHVLLEKPTANNAAEVEELIARRGDLTVGCCSLRHRLSDSAQAAQEFVATGALGPIRRIHVRAFRAAGPKTDGTPPPWRQSFSLNGGGVLTNWGCYDLDYVLGIAGWEFRPVEVLAQWWPCLPKFSHFVADDSDADSHFAAFVLGEDDSVLTIERGEFMPIRQEGAWQIIGDDGSLHLDMVAKEGNRILFDSATEEDGVVEEVVWEGDESDNDISMRLLDDFACAIREGRQPETSLERSLVTVSITDAIYRSAEQGTSIDIMGDWPL